MLLLDEPLSSLDVSIQAQVLNLLVEICSRRLVLPILFISHDIQVLSHLADELVVMYRGRIVEQGPKAGILDGPRHPYTQALLQCSAREASAPACGSSAVSISNVERNNAYLTGCAVRDRCPIATDICREVVPPLEEKAAGHAAACHRVPPTAPEWSSA